MRDIFDVLDETETITEKESPNSSQPSTPQQKDIFDIIQTEEVTSQPQDQEQTGEQPWYKSIPLDMLKGMMEGVTSFGRAMGPLRDDTPGAEQFSMEGFSEKLNEMIPTDSNVIGKGARRALKTAPLALSSPLASPVRAAAQSLGSGALGQAVEEAGGGTIAQTAAEILPFLASGGASGGKIPQKSTSISESASKSRFVPQKIREIMGKRAASQKEINELISFAENSGMTAEEITPLIQGETKQKILKKFTQREGATQGKLSRSKEAISEVADTFKTGKYADVSVPGKEGTRMINRMQDILYDMPAKTRNAILEDFNQLASSPKDTKSIIKFFRDVNAQYGEHKKQLGRLKEPLMDALASISPDLARDFNMTNKLFQKYYDISSTLKPSWVTQMFEYGVVPKLLYGSITGNYGLILEAVGETAGRKFATALLTEPKLQNLSKKMASTLNKGQFAVADKIKDEYIRLLKDDFPEIAVEMQKESFKDF